MFKAVLVKYLQREKNVIANNSSIGDFLSNGMHIYLENSISFRNNIYCSCSC